MIVVDTNIIGYLYLAGERSIQAELAYQKDHRWAAPLLWRSELRNVLALYLRREILSLGETLKIMAEATGLMEGREYEIPSLQILRLVAECTCSAYDCEFVALAFELKVPLITVDQKILTQFPKIAVSLDSFVI